MIETRKLIDSILEKTLIFLLGILVLDVLWQVASRYLLSSPSTFTDELAGFLLVWVGLLGSAYVTGKKQHLALGVLVEKLNKSSQKIFLVIAYALTGVFALAVMIIGGGWLIYTRFYLGQFSASLQIPLGYVYLILPLSGLLILYYSIVNAIEDLNQFNA